MLRKFYNFLPNCSLDLSIYIILYQIYDHVPSYIMSIGASIQHTLSYNPRYATDCFSPGSTPEGTAAPEGTSCGYLLVLHWIWTDGIPELA